jgi:hypothetical protein
MAMNTSDKQPADDIELLLPWRATGRLDPVEMQRVDAALAADAELRRKYALVQEELSETFAANSALDAPSVRVSKRLFEQIEAEARADSGQGLIARIVDFFGSLTPRAVAMSAAAAALAIVIQAGVLTKNIMNADNAYRTASTPQTIGGGSYALVAFSADATAKQISDLLESRSATIVDGPRSGGVYVVRVASKRLDPDELNAALAALTADRSTVRFAVPSEQR